MKRLCFASTLLVCAAFGQTKAQTFYFTHLDTRGLQESLNAIRATADMANVTMDSANSSITAQGTPDQLSIAAWLAKELDQTPGPRQSLAQHDYPGVVPQDRPPNQVIRVFYLAHIESPQDLQEVVNMTRSITDIQRFFPINGVKAIVARGEGQNVDMAAWMLEQVDQPAAAMKPGGRDYPAKFLDPRTQDRLAQIYVLADTDTPHALQDLITGVRPVVGIQRFFPLHSRKVIAMLGSTDQVAFTDWMLKLLDRPAAAVAVDTATHEYRFADVPWDTNTTARVFFLHKVGLQQLQNLVDEVRTTTHTQRVFVNPQTMAIMMRGTGDQISRAEQMLKDK
jgi:hypothetical protein